MRLSIYKETEEPVENVCFEQAHIAKVLDVLTKNFPKYFESFVDNKPAQNFGRVIRKAIKDFDQDRNRYKEILKLEALEEYEDDPFLFKSEILKNKCPVIRKTLRTNDKEFEKYKLKFHCADANELLKKITTICQFGRDCYEDPKKLSEIDFLDTENCSVYGVIGGGIKTLFLYKLYPALFPSRSQDALWALYFLSDKDSFDCDYESEFLMIEDTKKFVTQQNYFYPCELFYRYACEIYKLLEREAAKINLPLDENYRYVAVDAFLLSVAELHRSEIDLYKSQIRDGGSEHDQA